MKPRTRVIQLVAVALVTLVAGCELIVDFDRTKIPVEGADSGPTPEGGAPDTGAPSDGGGDGSDGSADAAADSADAAQDG